MPHLIRFFSRISSAMTEALCAALNPRNDSARQVHLAELVPIRVDRLGPPRR